MVVHLLAIWHVLVIIFKIISATFGVLMTLSCFAGAARDEETGQFRAWGYSFFAGMVCAAVAIVSALLHMWTVTMPAGILLTLCLLVSLALIFVPHKKAMSGVQVSMPSLEGVWPPPPQMPQAVLETRRLFLYGVSRSRVERAAQALQVQVFIVNRAEAAESIVVLQGPFRKFPVKLAEGRIGGVPVFFINSNAYVQIESALREVFSLPPSGTVEEHPTASVLEQCP